VADPGAAAADQRTLPGQPQIHRGLRGYEALSVQAPRDERRTVRSGRVALRWRWQTAVMLIIAIILFGMLMGGAAQLILGRQGGRIDWGIALVAGLVGSFIGGLLLSLIAGDGFEIRPSGIIGSIAGALIVTAAWRWYDRSQRQAAKSAKPTRR
jgi:uncharacterized membrane protein YeaQ/YmgE (transglycosylase-associated protein family)